MLYVLNDSKKRNANSASLYTGMPLRHPCYGFFILIGRDLMQDSSNMYIYDLSTGLSLWFTCDWLQVDFKRRHLPENKIVLLNPLTTIRMNGYVEVKNDEGEY